MNLLLWGLTISLIGKIFLAFGVLRAHQSIEKAQSIDDQVVRSLHKERTVTIIGVFLIVVGYLMEIAFFGGISSFFNCTGSECAALLYDASQ